MIDSQERLLQQMLLMVRRRASVVSNHRALAMISDGRIADAKTIMLLQYAALNIFR